MNKSSEEKRLNGLIAALEDRHPEREGRNWMPWATNDHPLAVEHWGLIQRRLNLRYARTVTTTQREAASRRLPPAPKGSGTLHHSVLAA